MPGRKTERAACIHTRGLSALRADPARKRGQLNADPVTTSLGLAQYTLFQLAWSCDRRYRPESASGKWRGREQGTERIILFCFVFKDSTYHLGVVAGIFGKDFRLELRFAHLRTVLMVGVCGRRHPTTTCKYLDSCRSENLCINTDDGSLTAGVLVF